MGTLAATFTPTLFVDGGTDADVAPLTIIPTPSRSCPGAAGNPDFSTFTVNFIAPNVTKQTTYSGTITFNSNDPAANTPFNFKVTATVNPPPPAKSEIDVYVDSVDPKNFIPSKTGPVIEFPEAEEGKPTKRTLVIKNPSTVPLNVFDFSSNLPNGFSLVTLNRPSEIKANGEASLEFQLDAKTAGTYEGDLSIPSNDADNPGYEYNGGGSENPYIIHFRGVVKSSTTTGATFTITAPSGLTTTSTTATFPVTFTGTPKGTANLACTKTGTVTIGTPSPATITATSTSPVNVSVSLTGPVSGDTISCTLTPTTGDTVTGSPASVTVSGGTTTGAAFSLTAPTGLTTASTTATFPVSFTGTPKGTATVACTKTGTVTLGTPSPATITPTNTSPVSVNVPLTGPVANDTISCTLAPAAGDTVTGSPATATIAGGTTTGATFTIIAPTGLTTASAAATFPVSFTGTPKGTATVACTKTGTVTLGTPSPATITPTNTSPVSVNVPLTGSAANDTVSCTLTPATGDTVTGNPATATIAGGITTGATFTITAPTGLTTTSTAATFPVNFTGTPKGNATVACTRTGTVTLGTPNPATVSPTNTSPVSVNVPLTGPAANDTISCTLTPATGDTVTGSPATATVAASGGSGTTISFIIEKASDALEEGEQCGTFKITSVDPNNIDKTGKPTPKAITTNASISYVMRTQALQELPVLPTFR